MAPTLITGKRTSERTTRLQRLPRAGSRGVDQGCRGVAPTFGRGRWQAGRAAGVVRGERYRRPIALGDPM